MIQCIMASIAPEPRSRIFRIGGILWNLQLGLGRFTTGPEPREAERRGQVDDMRAGEGRWPPRNLRGAPPLPARRTAYGTARRERARRRRSSLPATYELTGATRRLLAMRDDPCSLIARTTRSGAAHGRRTGARTGTACSPEEKLARPACSPAPSHCSRSWKPWEVRYSRSWLHLLAKGQLALHAIACLYQCSLEEKASCSPPCMMHGCSLRRVPLSRLLAKGGRFTRPLLATRVRCSSAATTMKFLCSPEGDIQSLPTTVHSPRRAARRLPWRSHLASSVLAA
ncbi:hypothetical protein Dimus_028552 [Dionaea muscipula]